MEGLFCANGLFALDLYRALSASNAEKNMFLSISAALSMIYLGARGDTAKEMAKSLSANNVERNTFFSPLSISAHLGARGDTATEMAKVLSFSSVSDVHSHFKTLTSTINRPSASYILKLANRLFGEKTFRFF